MLNIVTIKKIRYPEAVNLLKYIELALSLPAFNSIWDTLVSNIAIKAKNKYIILITS